MNQTLMQRAQCMRLNARLPKEFWAEAVNTACYLVNTSPSTAIDCKTRQEVWYGTSSDYSSLRIFGFPTYAHVNDGKLEPRAMKCIFLGYAKGVKGYRLWCTENDGTHKFIISRDVTFDESVARKWNLMILQGKVIVVLSKRWSLMPKLRIGY
ncbi:hypothetical protein MLD38_036781 [Melastoma candidum]|uniref:Uncharacterized protein n=1 Tax=Melastoma candidum TaxID=119954 RepID=A0ACB9LL51_9MYRT|nr:hypothetical protein MLD38_036781 [Melastoma candidum]